MFNMSCVIKLVLKNTEFLNVKYQSLYSLEPYTNMFLYTIYSMLTAYSLNTRIQTGTHSGGYIHYIQVS